MVGEGTREGVKLLATSLNGAVDWPLGRPNPKLLRLGDVTGDTSICGGQPAPSASLPMAGGRN